MFARLGRWCHRRRGVVVLLWLAVLVAGGAALSAVGTESRSEFTLPNVESKHGVDLLETHFGGLGTGDTGSIVFRSARGVDDPEVRRAMEGLFRRIARMENVIMVRSPYDAGNEHQVSRDGEIAYAPIELPEVSFEDAGDIADAIEDSVPRVAGLQVELGGEIFGDFEPPESELLGLAFAILILIVSFGSVLAMGLPIGVALAGIGVGSVGVGLLSNVMAVPDFATTLGVMIGLGVGIDYALFIVTRYRENLHAGHDHEESTSIAIDTAGRAVTFAATTVVISLLGLFLMGLRFVQGLAVGAASVVAVTAIASLTLLPALLGFARDRVEITRWRGLIAVALVSIALVGLGLKIEPLAIGLPLAVVVVLASFAVRPLRRQVPRRARRPLRETRWYRWSRLIQRRPWPAAIAGALVLVVLALPVLGLRLGFPDEGNYAEDTTTRKAYDLLADGFGPGFNGPFVLVVETPPGTTDRDLEVVTDAVRDTAGVAFVSPAFRNGDARTAALWRVVPASAPQDEATTDLVHRLREKVLPAVESRSGLDVAVAGEVAIQADFAEYLAKRLVLFFGAVLTLSFLLLMVVFRSVLVPLKAVVMNLLSIGASYGVVVAVFQWGWGGDLLNIDGAPIEPFMPMMLFAIVFGLSMDYEVFLLSRIKEEWDRTGDAHLSVADGLAATARVITAAAAIMVFVFGSFLLENDRTIKLFGAGLATAVLLDATVVRMLLVPATMELLGDRNWWLPRWLDRLLPRIDVEGPAHEADIDEDPEVESELVSS